MSDRVLLQFGKLQVIHVGPPKWQRREKVGLHLTSWINELAIEISDWRQQEPNVVKAAVDKYGAMPTKEYMVWYKGGDNDNESEDADEESNTEEGDGGDKERESKADEEDERRTKSKNDEERESKTDEENERRTKRKNDKGKAIASWPKGWLTPRK
ncbi:hypothetical protein AMTR_s00120p00081720 [Amborella trichopoda]|uniref:Aminotransferase-like plant mobile domain-containing protein n=1 Tax=Amborella trichopoda TaxID=13333 RepID=W1NT08_AMBTC|nr:hypothetical protein AMTR_s00120p00081720 [Amborella trichopoda]